MIYINEGDFITMLFTIVAVIAILVLAIAFYGTYVRVIKTKNKVKEALSGINVQLNKRYSLIPNILTIANKFMEHERDLLEGITALRSKASGIRPTEANIGEKFELDNQIASKMAQLFVSVENYPQLKSDQTMIQAMQTYSEVEEHIAAARRFYNSAVNEMNNLAEIFPSSIIAAIVGVSSYPFFEASEATRQEINAADYLKK